MSLCDSINIHYINLSSNKAYESTGPYPITDMQVSPDGDDTIIFSWLISGNATIYAGTLNFAIGFVCTTDSVVDYSWHTDVYSGITVTDSIWNDGEELILEYRDVLVQWANSLFGEGDSAVQRIKEAEEAALKAIEEKASSTPGGEGSAANGIPAGGTAGQILYKKSDADYDVEWADLKIPEQYGLITYDQDKTITIT